MSTRSFSTSFGSDDEPQAKSVHYNVQYVRRPLSPKRNISFERIRPQKIGRGRSQQRQAPYSRSSPSNSDDDFVHKVDRYGRRYGESLRRRSQSRKRHGGGREDHPHMSGGRSVHSESESECPSLARQPRSPQESRIETWSNTTRPIGIRLVDPEVDPRRTEARCKCRRCHQGRPGSQHDHGRRTSKKHDRSSRSRAPNRRTTTLRGILRKESTKNDVRPKLQKTVSFEDGAKVPHDWEESHEFSSDDQERTSRPKIPRRDSRAKQTRRRRQDSPVDAFLASNMQSSGTEEGSSICQGSSSENEVEILGACSRADPGYPQGARCRSCHHRPVNGPHRKRRTQWSRPNPIHPPSSTAAQTDERLRSIAHSILLSTHQPWCVGDCANLSRFARKMGACSACRRRRPNTRLTPACRSAPNCRTLILCHKFLGGLSGKEATSLYGECFDHALRFGYADVYCCAIPAYLTVEEYLAYCSQQVDEQDFGFWIRDKVVRKQIETIKRLGNQGVDVRVPPGPGRNFFISLAAEVEKTNESWKTVMENARMSGQPWGEAVVLKILEDMTGIWKPRWIREEYEWFWD